MGLLKPLWGAVSSWMTLRLPISIIKSVYDPVSQCRIHTMLLAMIGVTLIAISYASRHI